MESDLKFTYVHEYEYELRMGSLLLVHCIFRVGQFGVMECFEVS